MTNEPSRDALSRDSELGRIAVDLARRAGELALNRQAAGLSIGTKSSPTDIVTDADQAVESFLIAELAARRPGDAVLGEEQGAAAGAGAGVRWVLDPIDGTVNFMLGFPQFAVSIAAEVDGVVVAACVSNPATGWLFRARRGQGAWLERQGQPEFRLLGPRSVPLAESVLATGFSYDAARRARQGAVVGRLLGRVGNLRRTGSAALDLCAIAAGWVDGYFEGPLGEWDIAAGMLIAAEAGVALSGLAGRPAGPRFVAAAHPERIAEFTALLTEVGAEG
ncbi:MAG: putative myo-inositol 1-monophosphatase [Frankiales bacterium]|nr:putative myo-inositol 1-monophosphatase [Frankiales bacterium]